jgi:hypothetical protein
MHIDIDDRLNHLNSVSLSHSQIFPRILLVLTIRTSTYTGRYSLGPQKKTIDNRINVYIQKDMDKEKLVVELLFSSTQYFDKVDCYLTS